MKDRFKKDFKIFVIIFSVCLIYYIFVSKTGFYIPCIFRTVTGLKCPGCGVSHMLVALAHLDFKTAFTENPAIFLTLPLLAVMFGVSEYRYITRGTRDVPGMKPFLIFEIVILVLFGIMRNL